MQNASEKTVLIFLCKKTSSKKSAEVVLTEQHDELKVFGRNFFSAISLAIKQDK